MPKTKTPSKRTLKRAAKLLQAAHDHIELYGFNIHTYGDYERSRYRGSKVPPPMCYIGTVRFYADVDPDPSTGPQWNIQADPAEGDGPELGVALAAMDKVALRRLRRSDKDAIKTEHEHTTGRFVEKLGFEVQERAEERFPNPKLLRHATPEEWSQWQSEVDRINTKREKYEKAYALKLLRQALTEIHSES